MAMIALVPADTEEPELAVPGADDFDDLHVTVRYYEDGVLDPVRLGELHELAAEFASTAVPFVARVSDRGGLGDDVPQAQVLHLELSDDLTAVRDAFPELGPQKYPEWRPHLTVGYGIDDEALAAAERDNEILFDGVAVATDDDEWTIYPFGDPVAPAMTAALGAAERERLANKRVAMEDGSFPIRNQTDLKNAVQAIGRAKDRAATEAHIRKRAKALGLTKQLPDWLRPSAQTAALDAVVAANVKSVAKDVAGVGSSRKSKSKSGGKKSGKKKPGKKKRNKQVCDLTKGGSPATCSSVRWLRVYTALRKKRGMTKEKAARIANSMHRHWKTGVPRRGDKKPIVRKAFP